MRHNQGMRDQRNEREPSRAAAGDEDLTTRLDELSRPEMERVLERAIRLHADRSDAFTFTRDDIDQIAAELGISTGIVERAMEEELTEAPAGHESFTLLGPQQIVDRTTVEGARAEVEERLMAWMESEEGLRPASRTDDGVRWVPDSHWTTGARLALGTEGTKALRGMGQTTHRLTSLAEDRQLVEMEVDTFRVRLGAGLTGGGVSLAGLGGGLAVAFGMSGGSDIAQFLSVAAPMLAAGLASTLVVARAWTASVRKGTERALDGIAHPDLYRRASRRMSKRRGSSSGVERLVDEVSDALDRLLDRRN